MNEVTSTSEASKLTATSHLILFDGVCGLCNKFVQYVLNHDPNGRFHFASLQSNLAREILGRHGRDAQLLKTVYLIDQPGKSSEKLYSKSAAAIRVLRALQGPTSILGIFLLVPAPLRDIGYDIVAAVRYRIFGKSDTCPLPKPSDRERFLDI